MKKTKTTKNYFKNKNIVIFGGAGFIGSNLAIELVKKSANVLVVDSMIDIYGGNLFNLQPIIKKVKLNFSDIRDIYTLPFLLKNVDIIYVLAGQVSHILSMDDPITDLDINCKSQINLLQNCLKLSKKLRIVFASTRQIYGKPQYLPVDEKHPLEPVDINGIHKLAAEKYYTLFNKIYDIPVVVLRLTNTYGERMMIRNNKQGFLPIWFGKIFNNEKIQVFGSGSQLRDFNYISDVINALLIAGENDKMIGEIFNLGHHKYYSLFDVAELLKKLVNAKFEFIDFPENLKKIDIGDYYSDYKKIREFSGWFPRVNLEEGLKKTIDYYLKYKKYYL